MRKPVGAVFAFALVNLILATVCAAQQHPSTECLSYEPTVVKLTGTIVRETFPGPPNYQSTREGDQPETYWILKLASPVCVDAAKTDDVNRAQADVRSIQLVFPDNAGYKKYKDLISKEVVATGTLFGSISGHHHTAVLLTVKELTKAP
jgi:hypothetical protein